MGQLAFLEEDAQYWTEDNEDHRELEAEIDYDPEADQEPSWSFVQRKDDDREGSGSTKGHQEIGNN